MGFASSPATRSALAVHGIRVSGWVWRWALGLQGGTFPPHREINGERAATADSFEAYPGEDVNGSSCMCRLVPEYRTPDGRFARPDNLQPIFQPPVTASASVFGQPIHQDWTDRGINGLGDFVRFLMERAVEAKPEPERELTLNVPDGAFVVNVPQSQVPDVVVNVAPPETPVVNVAAPEVTVAAPNVTVETPTVNVAAPSVKVEPRIDVKPVVKVIRDKAKRVRFRRNAEGRIESAEVTEQ